MSFDWQAFDALCEEALAVGPPSARDVARANNVPLPCVDNDGNPPITFDVVGPNADYVQRHTVTFGYGDEDDHDATDEDWHDFWYGVGYPYWLDQMEAPF